MKKIDNKIIITIVVVLICLISVSVVIYYKSQPVENKIIEEKKIVEPPVEDNQIIEEKVEEVPPVEEVVEEPKKEEEKKEEPKKEDPKPTTNNNNQPKVNNNTNNNNQPKANNNTNNNQQTQQPAQQQPAQQQPEPQTPPTPTVTYTCPDGYQLNDKKCTSTVDPNYECPSGLTEYAGDRCINFSEGVETETESCPDDQGLLKMLGWNGPESNKYYCYPLYDKVYTCDDGYSLTNNKCVKTIDAIEKTN